MGGGTAEQCYGEKETALKQMCAENSRSFPQGLSKENLTHCLLFQKLHLNKGTSVLSEHNNCSGSNLCTNGVLITFPPRSELAKELSAEAIAGLTQVGW